LAAKTLAARILASTRQSHVDASKLAANLFAAKILETETIMKYCLTNNHLCSKHELIRCRIILKKSGIIKLKYFIFIITAITIIIIITTSFHTILAMNVSPQVYTCRKVLDQEASELVASKKARDGHPS